MEKLRLFCGASELLRVLEHTSAEKMVRVSCASEAHATARRRFASLGLWMREYVD